MTKIILTHHAQERLENRRISKSMIEQTIASPDQRFEQTEPQGSIRFIKYIQGRSVHVIATYLTQEKSWLIISTWVRGEEDRRPIEDMLIVSPFKIFWLVIKLFWRAFFGSSPKKRS